ncbi:MAG: Stringent starvation protein B, partial [Alphaproteobacteria bacterium]|nr:Stringent starvation protein B [Alphaproteobacteria bacterium]
MASDAPDSLIPYDEIVQEALRAVVGRVLGEVESTGHLPGDHHFYITFRTHAPGVRLSSRMREQYPEEMTIILQHQFEDLKVTENAFEVGLSFKGVPEVLLVPFDALTGFFDPSVPFNFKFEPQPSVETEEAGEPGATPASGPRPLLAPAAAPAPLAALAKVGASERPRASDKGRGDDKAAPEAEPAGPGPETGEPAKV